MKAMNAPLDRPRACIRILAWLMLPLTLWAATNQLSRPADALVELRGRVVCLAEEMHRSHQAGLPPNHQHIYGFKAGDGKYYTLLRTRFSEALFADQRVRDKELLLKGRVFPQTQILEPTTIRSIRNGVVHD